MKTDHEVRRMRNERYKGKTQEQAAARAGMSVRTARKYERLAQLPSQLKKPRSRTRPNPFEQDWPWVQAQLERDPALQVKTLFDELCLRFPDRYQPVQLRTLQRHVALWRATPARLVRSSLSKSISPVGWASPTSPTWMTLALPLRPCPSLTCSTISS